MFKFEEKIGAVILKLAEFSENEKTPVYFVGGMVRDALMGREIKDIDILIEGSAIDFVQNFKEKYPNLDVQIKSVHKAFDTAKTIIEGTEIDFASTREEDYPNSGCLPVVKNVGCKIQKDLKRRDFTINAIAARILRGSEGVKYEIFDPFSGEKDIQKKELKILHNKSYIDDPTRILRGVDFNLRFGFDFSNGDKALIKEYLRGPKREGMSLDRVKLTLKKLFGDNSRNTFIWNYILENKIYKIWADEPEFSAEWGERLSCANEVFNLEEPFKIFTEALFGPKMEEFKGETPYEIYSFFKKYSDSELGLYFGLFGDEKAVFYFKKLKNIKTILDGKALKKMGFEEGEKLGRALNTLLKEKINNPEKIKTREDEENFIRSHFQG